ncbi:MAG TPA: DUF1553 domain-containing protein [Thermoanaerobaculia bacterium]|nr:DUF1553 domain-containing protein [Thermoanaerobaculia bacterium]
MRPAASYRRQAVVAVIVSTLFTLSPIAASRRRAVDRPAAGPLPVVNYIDAEVSRKLASSRIEPAAVSGDEEFLRRVTLDLTGTIPLANDVLSFASNPSRNKRAAKIDDLLRSGEFVDRWTMWFGDLVQNVQNADTVRPYYVGRNAYHAWIHESIRTGAPYDAMVRELLLGEGDSFQDGPAGYIVRQRQRNGPVQDSYDNLAAHSAEKFLGLPLGCISCHSGRGHLEMVNGYLAGKTRHDFWRMASFFSGVEIREASYKDPNNANPFLLRFDVVASPYGEYRLNTTHGNKSPRAPESGQSKVVTPAFLLTGEQPRPGEPYRAAYGRMLTADRQFARATANYLWKEMFGRGLVEPVSSFDPARLQTQATHPVLLEALADDFIANGFNLRELLRTIASSSTYQLSSHYEGVHPDDSLFARRAPHRLPAEALIDAIVTATAVPMELPVQGMGKVPRAMQLPDAQEARNTTVRRFLNNFGRGNRDDIPRTYDGAAAQALALLNSSDVTNRVRAVKGSTVQKVLDATSNPREIADLLYLHTLSRLPNPEERRIAVAYLRAGPLRERTEDLQFALINSEEFLFV